ncbi:MAG: PD-(D/E)XK nuclease family protein [Thermoplasmatota archaeon]
MVEEPEAISASDLEKYAYCHLSWWLERAGQKAEGETVRTGEEEHRRVGAALEAARRDEAEARSSEVTVLWFAIVATILAVVGVALLPFSYADVFARLLGLVALIWLLAAAYFLFRHETMGLKEERARYEVLIVMFAMVAAVISVGSVALALVADPQMARVAEAAAVAWLIAATLFFYRSLARRGRAEKARVAQGIHQRGELDYVDTVSASPSPGEGGEGLLHSTRLGLRGRPDLILVRDGKRIPVEIKTGRTPRGPLFSHILQLGAYMLLVEESYGERPEEGIIRYPERDETIENSEELRMLVAFKLDEMRAKMKSGDVHRSHRRPGKCRGCSRRSGCPERLV